MGSLGCGRPGWYVERKVGVAGHVLVGYGEGESLAAARTDAAREIAEALGVSVHSSGEMVSEGGPEGASLFSRFRVSSVSRAILNDLSTVRMAGGGGRYYVALGYDNRTLFQKLAAAAGGTRQPVGPLGMGFKASLPLSDSLSSLGIAPSDYRAVRRHGGWFLEVGQALYPLPFDTWFRTLFVASEENRGLRIAVDPSGPLPSGSRYRVRITPPQPTGYLSLYHVSESGQALALMDTMPVDALDPILFPDDRRYAGLEALSSRGEGGRDMLLAIWTDEPTGTVGGHVPVSTGALTASDERAFSYGELLEHLGDALWVSCFVWIVR